MHEADTSAYYEATIYAVNDRQELVFSYSFGMPEDEFLNTSFPVVTEDDVTGSTLYLNARKVES